MKRNRTPKATPTPFTRSEFQLLASLVEDERQSPLAKTNARYDATLADILARLANVGSPNGEYLPTDAVTVR